MASDKRRKLKVKNLNSATYSVPDGVLNGGVGTIGAASTEPGGNVRFNLFFDILLMFRVFAFVTIFKFTESLYLSSIAPPQMCTDTHFERQTVGWQIF